jgi:hypothetical protein
VRERGFWDDYMTTYEEVFDHSSTECSPWYIIPADRKWFTRLVVSEIFCTKLKELNLQYPRISEDHRQKLLEAKKLLPLPSYLKVILLWNDIHSINIGN